MTVEQRFANVYAEPLSVTYQLPLPADGAVAGFSFVIDGERVLGRIEKRDDAREQFEEAVAEGRTAALLEQDRSSVFRQELGNVPPGKEVSIEVTVDQPLAWVFEGAWEWRWPCVVAPRYLGEEGRVPDGDRLVTEVLVGGADDAEPTVQLALSVRDRLRSGAAPSSPSHALASVEGEGEWRIALGGDERARLDRDLVVRWAVASNEPGVSIDAARVIDASEAGASERAFGVLTVVPPKPENPLIPLARDLIVLLDTSGSMHGAPLDQSKRVVSALVRGLDGRDSIELLAFGSIVQKFEGKALRVTETVRAKALKWIDALRASGGTEMRTGIASALAGVRDEGQRQVLLITDGLIGFEAEVIADILKRLPSSSRLHTLGVGSGVNRSLTGPAARAGRGSEHIVGIGEDVEPIMKSVLAKLEAPVITNVRVSGSGVRALGRERLPDVHAGSPLSIPVELAADGGGIVLEGDTATGVWRSDLDVLCREKPVELKGSAHAALFARERVEDLEMHRAARDDGNLIDRAIEELGLSFGIATRLTSWVAVSERASVDPSLPTRRVVQPQALPYGMSAEGVGLRSPAVMARFAAAPRAMAFAAAPHAPAAPRGGDFRSLSPSAAEDKGAIQARGGAASWLKKALGIGAKGAAASEVEGSGSFEHELEGKILLQKPDHIVIAATLDIALDWQRPERVTLELDDGSRIELAVDQRSTASGSLQVGQSVRLWLTLLGPLTRKPVALTMTSLRIALSR